jgi:hypothetical protein
MQEYVSSSLSVKNLIISPLSRDWMGFILTQGRIGSQKMPIFSELMIMFKE